MTMNNHSTIVIPRKNIGDVKVTKEILYQAVQDFAKSIALDDIIEWIVEKNKSYGNSWAEDGLFINLSDIKDKLTRVDIILGENNQLSEQMVTQDGYGNAIFDLWVRCTLCLIFDNHVKTYLKKHHSIDIDKKDLPMGFV